MQCWHRALLLSLLVCLSLASSGSVDPSQVEADATTTNEEGSQADALPSSTVELGRFPLSGTDEFDETCGWASPASPNAAPAPRWACSLLVRPRPSTNEGLGEWVSEIGTGFLMAVQTGCRVLIDYGTDVDIGRVIVPAGDDRNWTVPDGFVCDRKTRCHHITGGSKDGRGMELLGKSLGVRMGNDPVLVAIPFYRFAYSSDVFEKLSAVLPAGFRPHQGFACGFGSLFQLAPTVAEFIPQLFSHILPAVRDPTALVIALYIRTGRSDSMASAEKRGEDAKAMEGNDRTTLSRVVGEGVVQCALRVEEERLLSQSAAEEACSESSSAGVCRRRHDRVVWTIISDSPNVGRIMTEKYSRSQIGSTPDGATVPRHIVTTATRGVHSRQQRGPSTADFAEAFLDYWLIGESDAVVMGGEYSFGRTGALRTARPLYMVNHKGVCVEQEWSQ